MTDQSPFAPLGAWLLGLCLVLGLGGSALAQEPELAPVGTTPSALERGLNPYEWDLLALSEHLGALHHLRGQCETRDRRHWRNTMKELVRLEQPSRRLAAEMTQSFNEGFHGAKAEYPDCTVDTRRRARIVANEAAMITTRLSVALE